MIEAKNTNSNNNDFLKIFILFLPERDKVNEKQRDNRTNEFIISLNTAKYILTDRINEVIRISIKIIGKMNF
jgi:hypothetical protein